MDHLTELKNLVLAPYILKATALIGVSRKCGGNQFRHQFAVLGILLDYKIYNPVLLKSALLHDLKEDWKDVDLDEIRNLDSDGPAVVELILAMTKRPEETKIQYLQRLVKEELRYSTINDLKILKSADRIHNLTDLHSDTHSPEKMKSYLDQTVEFVIPMALDVNLNMVLELTDLVLKRRNFYNL
jgi:(p)ppGpp synthase/HD superfamily hydrolase